MIKRVTKDFETRSQCDLKKCGAYKYSLDPTTMPTCLAFKILGESTVYFLNFETVNRQWKDQSETLRNLWERLILENYQFSAHNSFFEKCIYDNILVKRYGWPRIFPRQRRCTAAKAAACALPRSLEGAGEALKLSVQKDRRGYVAMMKTCKPTKWYNAWMKTDADLKAGRKVGGKRMEPYRLGCPPMFLEPDADPQTWQTLYTYCKIDVRAEEAIDMTLPDLIPVEQEIWHLNQKINWRGLRIDMRTVLYILKIINLESRTKHEELDSLTMGLVTKPGARQSILDFLALEGIELPNLQAKTVSDKLEGFELSEDMHRLLEIRKALSMTSTKKYQAFENRVNDDGYVRDIQLYHGASTGRNSGTGIQIENLPKGLIKMDKNRPYAAVENVAELDYDMLKILYGESLGVLFSALLRNMILPTKGCELFVADFSRIEVAVLWWLADNETGLKVLRDGLDPYIHQAAFNTGKPYLEITDDERQLAKAQILGCGFGMAGVKFQKTAWDLYRLKLSLKQSRISVLNYRKANARVPAIWREYENAAVGVIKHGGSVRVGKCEFIYEKDFKRKVQFLWIELPSGRRLAYADPQISWRVVQYDAIEENEKGEEVIVQKTSVPKETLEFWAVDSKTKKWGLERTFGARIAENITQAAARDLLMQGMLRLEKSGYRALFTVHDEAICESPVGGGDLKEFIEIFCETPSWGKGLPIEAKGWTGPRYRKG